MTRAVGRNLVRWLHEEFRSETYLPALTSGVLMGISEFMFALSLGSLIFSGDLATYLPLGLGIALVSSIIMLIGTSLISRVPGVISSVQDSTSVVLGVIVAALAATLGSSGADEKLATILAAISLTTILTGCMYLAFGYFNLGRLVRFVPYPVVGGFLAGTGWLLVQGSFGVMSGYSLTLANLPALFQSSQLILWIPGVLFAVVLFFGMRRSSHYLTLPVILIGGITAFYLAFFLTGIPIQEAISRGLLLGQMGGNTVVHPFILVKISSINWLAILQQSGNIAVVITLAVISLLLNASALELAIHEDIQLNHELKSAGVANLLSGLIGGMVGYHTLSLSTLSHRIGAKGRLPGIIAGLFCLGVLLIGSTILAYFPKPILGGLLFFLGLDFLAEWVVAGWKKLARSDYAVVIVILLVISTTNFLTGMGVGLIAMTILFVLSYSRISVVHHAISGTYMRSNVERCAYHRRVLEEELGQRIFILELQGFIFFGTANTLLEQIRARGADTLQPNVHYILLDFRRVTGLDSSAVLSFVKGKQLAEAQGITLVLTHISEKIQRQFELGGLFDKGKVVCTFPDLDHGLEWCEEQLLEIEQVTALHVPVTLSAQLADSGFKKADTARLEKFLERVKIRAGEFLMRQGDEADKLYFIEQGTVSIYLEIESGQRMRLQTLGLGTAVGEPSLYLGTTYTASVIADSSVTAYQLTRAALSEMKQVEPELAATFHEFVARLLSERLAATTRTLEAVLK